jgi:hypothetical protein
MSTSSAVGVCLQKIPCVRVDIEDHVRSMKPDRGIGVCCQIIKQLFCFGHCVIHPFRLFACYCAECHEHSEVDSASVVKDAPDDVLDVFDVVVAEGGRRVGRGGDVGPCCQIV